MRRLFKLFSRLALSGSILGATVAYASPADRIFAKKARLTVARILSGAEFQPRKLPWYERWIEKLVDAIADAGAFIAERAPIRAAAGLIALAILMIVLAYVLRFVNRSRVNEFTLPEEEAHADKLGAIALRRRAEEAASQADYRSALRFLYLSFLADLRERGLLSDRTDLTNWEYISRLWESGARQLIDQAEALTKVFEKSWYGQRTVSREDYERFSLECKP